MRTVLPRVCVYVFVWAIRTSFTCYPGGFFLNTLSNIFVRVPSFSDSFPYDFFSRPVRVFFYGFLYIFELVPWPPIFLELLKNWKICVTVMFYKVVENKKKTAFQYQESFFFIFLHHTITYFFVRLKKAFCNTTMRPPT